MSSPMLFLSFFRWFDEISVVVEAKKILPNMCNKKQNGCMAYTFF